jgi:hypothetical protein
MAKGTMIKAGQEAPPVTNSPHPVFVFPLPLFSTSFYAPLPPPSIFLPLPAHDLHLITYQSEEEDKRL